MECHDSIASAGKNDDQHLTLLSNDFRDDKPDIHRRTSSLWFRVFPWVLSLALLIGWIIEASGPPAYVKSSPWTAGEMEIAQAELSGKTKRIRFTGGLRYNETGYLYRQIDTNTVDYVAHPTTEIDDAWSKLISTTDVFLTKQEVANNVKHRGTFSDLPAGDELYTDPYSGLFQAVPSVFHDLHCLDRIRRAIYIDHYPQDRVETYWPHIQHCIDTIRQTLICHADLTPIPEAYTPFKPNGALEPIFQVYHTCRDFEGIQRWAKTRDALDESVWHANAERLLSQHSSD